VSTSLRINTLGGLTITLDGEPVSGFVSRKVDALLVYLAANPREHPREVLGELLWDDLPQDRTLSYLRTALSSLQKQLSPFLIVTRQSIAMNPDSDYWLDIAELSPLLDAAEHQWQEQGHFTRQMLEKLQTTLELYRGHFMDGFNIRNSRGFEGWMILEQERLRNQVMEVYFHMGSHMLSRGQYSDGINFTNRAIQLDPLWEKAHRQMMLLLAHSGQRSAALAQYETCVHVLYEELGVEPEEETDELYERIKAGDLVETPAEQSTPHNLPAQHSVFVDRPEELQTILSQLESPKCRLLTLVGPGGVGKTRLAVEAAHQLLPEFPDGVYFVPFAKAISSDEILNTIANVLGLTFKRNMSPRDALENHLTDRSILIVLDSFEWLLPGAAVLSDILAFSKDTKLLITSRERLNLREEWVESIMSLNIPPDDGENLIEFASVQLFVQTAQQIKTDFAVEDNLQSIAEICRIVGGLPLAIELAASWVRMLTCEQIIIEIQQGLDFLTSSLRNIPERHSSVRAVFESVWRMLSEQGQRIFRQLSIFEGGFTPDAARAVTEGSLLELSALVDKSLLHPGDGRYRMHALLRQFADEKLDEYPEERQQVELRHSEFFAQYLARREGLLIREGADDTYREVILDAENIQRAWFYALSTGNLELINVFLRPLFQIYFVQSDFVTGEKTFQMAAEQLSAPGSGFQLAKARALLLQGTCQEALNKYEAAKEAVEEAYPILVENDEAWEMQLALRCYGRVAYATGDYTSAQHYFELARGILEQSDEPLNLVAVLLRLSDVATVLGQYSEARDLLEECLFILDGTGSEHNQMRFLITLGDVNLKLGNVDDAYKNFELALEQTRTLQARTSEAVALVSLGRAEYALGNYDAAREYCQQSITICDEIHNLWGKAFALMYLSRIARAVGDYSEARFLINAGMKISDQIGSFSLQPSLRCDVSKLAALMGEMDRARENAAIALETAKSTGSMPMVLSAILTNAMVLCELGDHQRAYDQTMYVINSPVIDYETLQEAEALRARLEGEGVSQVETNFEEMDTAAIVTAIAR